VTLLGGDKDSPAMRPNGHRLSADEKHLLRNGWRPQDAALRRSGVTITVANPKVFLEAGNDGIKTDRAGNVYSSGAGQRNLDHVPGRQAPGHVQAPADCQGAPAPHRATTKLSAMR